MEENIRILFCILLNYPCFMLEKITIPFRMWSAMRAMLIMKATGAGLQGTTAKFLLNSKKLKFESYVSWITRGLMMSLFG